MNRKEKYKSKIKPAGEAMKVINSVREEYKAELTRMIELLQKEKAIFDTLREMIDSAQSLDVLARVEARIDTTPISDELKDALRSMALTKRKELERAVKPPAPPTALPAAAPPAAPPTAPPAPAKSVAEIPEAKAELIELINRLKGDLSVYMMEGRFDLTTQLDKVISWLQRATTEKYLRGVPFTPDLLSQFILPYMPRLRAAGYPEEKISEIEESLKRIKEKGKVE